ncbi:metallophosphoesterase family protein [Spirosoma areae]
MRIVFITDPHLGAEDEQPEGVDVRQNFRKALAYTTDLKPNCVVVGGDICNATGDRAIYEWAKNELDKLSLPYYIIAGNHDDSPLMADVFRRNQDRHDRELYYALPLEGRPALFLDSAKGEFSATQWTWFGEYMRALKENNLLIFMHHPPLPADVTFMDTKYPFRQSDEFLKLTHDLPCHVTVVCGHYHVEKVVQRGNLLALLSPSTFYQMKQDTPGFAIDHYQIGIREINLTTHGTTSTVHYIDPDQPKT